MFNEDSCRACGLMLIAMWRCNECLETSSWICKNCNSTIDRIHLHAVANSQKIDVIIS